MDRLALPSGRASFQRRHSMNKNQISRREILELGASATLGAIVSTIEQPSSRATANTLTQPATLSGLAAEYDQYDGLGLAALVVKRQVTALELLNAARQRLEAVNPKINAVAEVFFDKAENQIKSGLPRGPFTGVPFV